MQNTKKQMLSQEALLKNLHLNVPAYYFNNKKVLSSNVGAGCVCVCGGGGGDW